MIHCPLFAHKFRFYEKKRSFWSCLNKSNPIFLLNLYFYYFILYNVTSTYDTYIICFDKSQNQNMLLYFLFAFTSIPISKLHINGCFSCQMKLYKSVHLHILYFSIQSDKSYQNIFPYAWKRNSTMFLISCW